MFWSGLALSDKWAIKIISDSDVADSTTQTSGVSEGKKMEPFQPLGHFGHWRCFFLINWQVVRIT